MYRKILVIVLAVVFVSSAFVFLLVDWDNDGLSTYQELTSLGTNPLLIDTDGDALLDGKSIVLGSSDMRLQQLRGDGIVCRIQSDGNYLFYGEQYFGSIPSEVSWDEANQAKFLSALSQQEEYQQLEAQGLLLNKNLDGDSWSNYFEQSVSKTPYNVKNDIYAIIMTHAGQDYPPVKEMFDILEKARIPKENMYDLSVENNNSVEFEAVVEEIAQEADENDVVLIVINGEGGQGEFQFHGVQENGVWHPLEHKLYTWFNDRIDRINSNSKVIILDTCYSGSAIPYLEGEGKLVLTSAKADQTSGFGIGYDFLKAFSNPSADSDNNGYVSIGEASDYAKKMETFEARQAQISDVSNIGPTSYLIELKLEK